MAKQKVKMSEMELEDCNRVVDNGENCIEFCRDSEVATVCFSQRRYVTRIKNLAEKYPNECVIVDENYDGSVVAHVPTKWIKVSPPKQVSDEFKEAAGARMKELRKQGKMRGRSNNG